MTFLLKTHNPQVISIKPIAPWLAKRQRESEDYFDLIETIGN